MSLCAARPTRHHEASDSDGRTATESGHRHIGLNCAAVPAASTLVLGAYDDTPLPRAGAARS